jgi:hypothetical protein
MIFGSTFVIQFHKGLVKSLAKFFKGSIKKLSQSITVDDNRFDYFCCFRVSLFYQLNELLNEFIFF